MKWPVWFVIIYLAVTDVSLYVTIEQPPVLTAAVGQDIILPCNLKVSNNDKVTNAPVLYWVYEMNDNGSKLWPPSGKYQDRVTLLDQEPESLNKSIRFKRVQWDDKGKYQCKVSVTSQQEGSFRKKGNETELLIYGKIFFYTTGLNNSQLQCGVHVTWHREFTLSISHNFQMLNSTPGQTDTSLHYVTLSQTITLGSHQKYECSLNFNGTLVTASVFQGQPLVGGIELVDENVTSSPNVSLSGPSDSEPEEYPEPWLLYGGLILVPVVFILVLMIVNLTYSC